MSETPGFIVPALQAGVDVVQPEGAPRVHSLPLPPAAALVVLWQSEPAAERLQTGFVALLLRAWAQQLLARPGLTPSAPVVPTPESLSQAGQLFWARAQQHLRQIYGHQPDLAHLDVAAACVLLLPESGWLWYAGAWQGQCNDQPLHLSPQAPPGQSDPATLPAPQVLRWPGAEALRLALQWQTAPAALLHWPADPFTGGLSNG